MDLALRFDLRFPSSHDLIHARSVASTEVRSNNATVFPLSAYKRSNGRIAWYLIYSLTVDAWNSAVNRQKTQKSTRNPAFSNFRLTR